MKYNVNMICPAITLDHNYIDEHDDATIVTLDTYEEAIQYASDYRASVNRHEPILYIIPVDKEFNTHILNHLLYRVDSFNKDYYLFKNEIHNYFE